VHNEKAVRAKEVSDKTELSDKKELPVPHANRAHGKKELPDETELPDEKGPRGKPFPQWAWVSVGF